MEQKNLTGLPPSLSPSGSDGTTGRDDVERLKQLINSLEECSWGELPPAVQQSLHGLEGLRRLAGAITILLIDYGGATPWGTCDSVEETAPELYREFGYSSVLALREEIQHSEIPDQSAVFQDLFERFNLQYFAGALPDYKILVVYGIGRRNDVDIRQASRLHARLQGSSISRHSKSSSGTAPIIPADWPWRRR
jgi:hypothetical protein